MIIPNLFAKKVVKEIGQCAIDDMREAVDKLRDKHGIDLFENEGKRIENFNELSMREARRCDLR